MYQKILIAIAPETPDTIDEMLPIAKSLLAEGGKLAAVSVVEAMPVYLETHVPSGIYENTRKDTAQRLQTKLEKHPEIGVVVDVGLPAQALLETQKRGDFDLIIIRSHRPALRDWILGTTAGRIVRDAPCAVHVVR